MKAGQRTLGACRDSPFSKMFLKFSNQAPEDAQLYLHIGPSGDSWTGAAMFAAKHLQPGYVKSIALPKHTKAEEVEALLASDLDLALKLYDTPDVNLIISRIKPKET